MYHFVVIEKFPWVMLDLLVEAERYDRVRSLGNAARGLRRKCGSTHHKRGSRGRAIQHQVSEEEHFSVSPCDFSSLQYVYGLSGKDKV